MSFVTGVSQQNPQIGFCYPVTVCSEDW